MRELEQEIETLEGTIAELEAQLSDPAVTSDHQKMQAVCETLGAARERSEACFEELIELEQ